ncbi:hypothetical protein [Desulfovibrio desulfuricans]|uniref:hypothetical protein n=1 Tax=Desulfovibrio desulfuricans TaxID=876 RepID=UPI003983F254
MAKTNKPVRTLGVKKTQRFLAKLESQKNEPLLFQARTVDLEKIIRIAKRLQVNNAISC